LHQVATARRRGPGLVGGDTNGNRLTWASR
jgi:hypothetical protein